MSDESAKLVPVFEAWKARDLEFDPAELEGKRLAFKAAVRAFLDEYYPGFAHWAFILYFRDQYADWRIQTDPRQ